MYGKYLVFLGEIIFLNILSYQMEANKVESFFPILFNVYINTLLLELKGSSCGCHINNTFVEALCYADDVTLLSHSIRGLNAMINLCAVFAKNLDVTFKVVLHPETYFFTSIFFNNFYFKYVDIHT